jgi:hypothetical protein
MGVTEKDSVTIARLFWRRAIANLLDATILLLSALVITGFVLSPLGRWAKELILRQPD